jgi:hypothetical protein
MGFYTILRTFLSDPLYAHAQWVKVVKTNMHIITLHAVPDLCAGFVTKSRSEQAKRVRSLYSIILYNVIYAYITIPSINDILTVFHH